MLLADLLWWSKMDFFTLSLGIKFIGGILATGILAVFLATKRRKNDKTTIVYPKDTVILHRTDKGPYAPSISPFVMKLETYLRIHKIPYQSVCDNKRGRKGKLPWIEYNGEIVSDTQFIIKYLNNLRHIDYDDHLTPEMKSSAHALQRMVDEHTYWIMIHYRWVIDNEKKEMRQTKWSNFKIWLVTKIAKIQTYIQGVGRHTNSEVLELLDQDVGALSSYLGEKPYMLGDNPGKLDCSVFGQLSQFKWHLSETDANKLIIEKYPNINKYLERMKTTYWPDWEDSITHGCGDK